MPPGYRIKPAPSSVAGKAESTRRAYRSDWAQFVAWCERFGFQGLRPLRRRAEFLSHEALRGSKPRRWRGASQRSGSAINSPGIPIRPTTKDCGKGCAHPAPDRSPRPTQKAAATADVLAALLMRTPDTLTGKRDRALFVPRFAGAFPPERACRPRRGRFSARIATACGPGAKIKSRSGRAGVREKAVPHAGSFSR